MFLKHSLVESLAKDASTEKGVYTEVCTSIWHVRELEFHKLLGASVSQTAKPLHCMYMKVKIEKNIFYLYKCFSSYQTMFKDLTGRVHSTLVGGDEEDGIEVAGEAHEDHHGAHGPNTKQEAASRSCHTASTRRSA